MKEENVNNYIARAPKWAEPMLQELRKAIKAAAPKAKESISYHIPYYSQNGRLAYFAVNKKHIGFHWISAEDRKNFAKELASEKVVGSTLHIPQGEKVPAALIKKIVRWRVKSNEARKRSHGGASSDR